MFDVKAYASEFIIKHEGRDYILEEYIGQNDIIKIPNGVTRISWTAFRHK